MQSENHTAPGFVLTECVSPNFELDIARTFDGSTSIPPCGSPAISEFSCTLNAVKVECCSGVAPKVPQHRSNLASVKTGNCTDPKVYRHSTIRERKLVRNPYRHLAHYPSCLYHSVAVLYQAESPCDYTPSILQCCSGVSSKGFSALRQDRVNFT